MPDESSSASALPVEASRGQKTNEAYVSVVDKQKCKDCGSCVAVCRNGAIQADENIWHCTERDYWTETCPEGVNCRDMIRDLRGLALEDGLVKHVKRCGSCGSVYVPLPVSDYLNQKLKGMLFHGLDLCPSCRRQVYFRGNA